MNLVEIKFFPIRCIRLNTNRAKKGGVSVRCGELIKGVWFP
jgi:hypothetical protein